MKKWLFGLLSIAWMTPASAQNVNCKIEEIIRIPSTYSTLVTCNGSSGYIANDEKVSSVTIEVTNINNAKQLIKLDGYFNVIYVYSPQFEEWSKIELSKRGINFSRVRLQSFEMEHTPALYGDIDGKFLLFNLPRM